MKKHVAESTEETSPPSGECEHGARSGTHIDDLKQIVSGTGINLIGSVSRTIFNFLYAVFLALFLSPGNVGLYYLGFTIFSILGTVAYLGLDTGILRYVAIYDGAGDRERVRGTIAGAIAMGMPFAIVLGSMVFIFAAPISVDLFSKPGLTGVMKGFAVAIPVYVLARYFNASTQGLRQMKYQVYSRDTTEQMLKFILSAGVLGGGLGLLGVVHAYIAALVIALILSFYFLQKVEPVFSLHLKRIYRQRQLASYSAPLAVSALLGIMLLWVDTLFLGHFRSADEVGIYSIAMRLSVVGSMVMVSFNTMFAPLVSDFYNRGERDRLERLLRSVTKWIAALSLPIFLALALYPQQALSVMGSQYQAGATVLIVLCMGKMFDAISGPVSFTLIMCGRPRVVLFINILAFLSDVVLCLILIPRYGATGAALALGTTLVLFNLSSYSGVRSLLKLQPFSSGYFKVIGAAAVSVLLALVFKELIPQPWNLAVSFVAFAGCYTVFTYKLVFDSTDMMLINMIWMKLANRNMKETA